LGLLEAGDALEEIGAMALHGLCVPLGVVVLPVGKGCLRQQGAQPGVVSGVGEMGQLLVGDPQVVAELPQARGDLREAALDEGPGHRGECRSGRPADPSRHATMHG